MGFNSGFKGLTFNFARINVEVLTELSYTSVQTSFSKLGSCRKNVRKVPPEIVEQINDNVGIPRKIPSMPRNIVRISDRHLAILK